MLPRLEFDCVFVAFTFGLFQFLFHLLMQAKAQASGAADAAQKRQAVDAFVLLCIMFAEQ
jgi:hypothetical protein